MNFDVYEGRFSDYLRETGDFESEDLMKTMFASYGTREKVNSESWNYRYMFWKATILACIKNNVFGDSSIAANTEIILSTVKWKSFKCQNLREYLDEMILDGTLQIVSTGTKSSVSNFVQRLLTFNLGNNPFCVLEHKARVEVLINTIISFESHLEIFGLDTVMDCSRLKSMIFQAVKVNDLDSEILIKHLVHRNIIVSKHNYFLFSSRKALFLTDDSVLDSIIILKNNHKYLSECSAESAVLQEQRDSLKMKIERVLYYIEDAVASRELIRVQKVTSRLLNSLSLQNINLLEDLKEAEYLIHDLVECVDNENGSTCGTSEDMKTHKREIKLRVIQKQENEDQGTLEPAQ